MEMLQHGLVTLAAAAAAVVIFRRVFTTFTPVKGRSQCASCPGASPRAAGKPETKPQLVPLLRSASGGGRGNGRERDVRSSSG